MGEQVDLPTGERLNRLLARSEDEFDMFQMIDVEMERERRDLWLAEGNQGPLPPRLMQDINELPDYLRAVEDTAVLKKFNDLVRFVALRRM